MLIQSHFSIPLHLSSCQCNVGRNYSVANYQSGGWCRWGGEVGGLLLQKEITSHQIVTNGLEGVTRRIATLQLNLIIK